MADDPKVRFGDKREMDAAAFAQAADMLDQARQNMDDTEMVGRALEHNRLLWSIIRAGAAEKNNALPDEIKPNLMSLSIFVDRQTAKGLTKASEELFDSLININLNISEGLTEST